MKKLQKAEKVAVQIFLIMSIPFVLWGLWILIRIHLDLSKSMPDLLYFPYMLALLIFAWFYARHIQKKHLPNEREILIYASTSLLPYLLAIIHDVLMTFITEDRWRFVTANFLGAEPIVFSLALGYYGLIRDTRRKSR